jgi:hypothetical protein
MCSAFQSHSIKVKKVASAASARVSDLKLPVLKGSAIKEDRIRSAVGISKLDVRKSGRRRVWQ